MNINAGLGRISSWQQDRNIRHKWLRVGVLEWISHATCLMLISKARKHGLKSSSLKSKKENHLELSQDVKLMNTI